MLSMLECKQTSCHCELWLLGVLDSDDTWWNFYAAKHSPNTYSQAATRLDGNQFSWSANNAEIQTDFVLLQIVAA